MGTFEADKFFNRNLLFLIKNMCILTLIIILVKDKMPNNFNKKNNNFEFHGNSQHPYKGVTREQRALTEAPQKASSLEDGKTIFQNP